MGKNSIPSWKEVAERVVKNTAIFAGQELLTKKIVPAASSVAKKVWAKIKEEKSDKLAPQIKAKPQKVYRKAEVINGDDKFVVEAEFIDEVKPK